MEISTVVFLCPQQKYLFESFSFQGHFRALLDTSVSSGLFSAAGIAILSSANSGQSI
jgi:hypothetical protein